MFIQTENTPNPSTVKFIPGEAVLNNRTVEFKSAESAERSPLAKRLFKIDGVTGVFFGSDFVSVTKEEGREWLSLKPLIMAAMFEHFSSDEPILNDMQQAAASAEETSETVKIIKELLDTRIRPAVAQDGGDIEFQRFENGILYLSMHGACSGCPSSTMTLKSGIENMMRHYVPDVIEVRAVQDY